MEKLKGDIPPFPEFIKDQINRRLEEHGGTAKDFAISIGLKEVSMSRYRKHGCRIDSPNAKALLGVLVKDPELYAELMIHYFKEESDFWENLHARRKYFNQSNSLAINNYVMRDSIYYFIFVLASLDNGLPFELVDKIWAKMGIDHAQDLIDAGILEWDGECIVGHNKRHSYGDIKVVKNNIVNVAIQFPEENIVNKTGMISNVIGNLNEEGIEAMRGHGLEAATKFVEIVEDPKHQGNIPVSASVFTGKLQYGDIYAESVDQLFKERQEEKKNDA